MAEEMKDDAKDEKKDEAKAKDGDAKSETGDKGDDKNPFAFFGDKGGDKADEAKDGDKAEAKGDKKAEAKDGDKAEAKEPEPQPVEAEAPAGSNGHSPADDAAKDAPPPTAGTEQLEVEPLIKARDLVPGDPNAEAPPPRKAPSGDARSFRRGDDFAFVYRDGAYLITRLGKVGKNGEWNCVEYPDQGAAAHAYAMRCSDLTGEGFRDLR